MATQEELLWDSALRRLGEEHEQSAALLKQESDIATVSVRAIISDIESLKEEHEKDGWNITIPEGTLGLKRRRVINVRESVYSVLEAALEFNDIVTNVLKFDATHYGAVAWSVVSFGMKVSPHFPLRV